MFGPQPWTWLTFGLDGTLLDKRQRPVGYYPKTNGVVALAHDGERFLSWDGDTGEVTEPDGLPVGVHATGVSPSGQRFFYRRGDGVFTATGAYCENVALPNAYASYGLWECRDDGTCKTWDERYYGVKPDGVGGQVYATPDGRLVVGEGAGGGVVGTIDGEPFTLWPGEDTRWPRAAHDGTTAAIVAWSDAGPTVRLAILTLDELKAMVVAPAVPQPIAPFAEPFWAWAYKDDDGQAPKNVLTRSDGALVANGRVVGWNLAIEGDLFRVSATALACKAIENAPVFCYLGRDVPETPIDGLDFPVLQAYRMPGTETAALILAKLRADLARCAYPRVALAVDLTDRTLAGVGGWPEADRIALVVGLADLCRTIRPAAVFAWAWNRNAPQAGISSSATITEQWRRFVAAIPSTTGGAMSEHLDTVRAERAKYPPPRFDANGVLLNPMGNENAARISRAVAWAHRGEGWGLLDKPTGNNVLGYSVDVIINARERQVVDILGSSEAECVPVWNPIEWRDDYAARWRPPLDPDTLLPAPDAPTLDHRVLVLEALVARITDWIGGF